MRKKLTDRAVANTLPPKTGRLEINDTLEPAFVFSVTSHDHRAFSVRVWTGPKDKRKQRRVLLGHPREIDGAPKLTLAEAREAARSVKQAAAEGKALVPGDGTRGAQTWGQLSEEYVTWAQANRRPSTAEEIRRIMRSRDLAEWRDRPAVRISADDVMALRDRVHERGASMATKVVRIISGMGIWAVDERKLPANPAKGVRPRAPEKARERVLSDVEVGTFWRACDRLGYPYGPIGKLLLLTATRVREIGQLPWSELNLDFRTWILPAERTKPGRSLTVHLSRPAVVILRELQEHRANARAAPYVFVGADGGLIESFSHMKEKLDEAMEAEFGEPPAPFQLRDLRRTAATVMARLGIAPHVVERLLNHKGAQALGGPLAAVYNQWTYDDARIEALDKLSEFVVALAEPKVVPFKRVGGADDVS
jgi:integrase